jgi:predicted outer membrane protein
MVKSIWIALPLLTAITLAGCVSPSPPPSAPPPAPPPAPEAPPAPSGPPTASSDQDFINLATGLDQSEIGMGRLARGKGASKAVRAFAEHMVVDHTRVNERLAALAKRLQLAVAPPPDQPPPDLLTTSGPDFDKAYIGLAIRSHQDAIARRSRARRIMGRIRASSTSRAACCRSFVTICMRRRRSDRVSASEPDFG